MIALAEIIDRNPVFRYKRFLDNDQRQALHAISICRTPKAQGAIYACENCPTSKFVSHSCGNRACPNCQNHKTTLWLHRQKSRLLPCEYVMITLTVPKELRDIPRERLREFYDAFFDCSSEAIKELALDKLKGTVGMVGVLHTNARNLVFHPHVHYIVPAMTLGVDKKSLKKIKAKFFLHQQVLANLFRGKLLSKLKELEIPFPGYLYAKKWQADCKKKGNGIHVLEYLSRYLIKGPVSQKALSYTEEDKIKLRYQNSTTKKMTSIVFEQETFLRQLIQHVLPKGFRRVREYGFLAPAGKKLLKRIQILLNVNVPESEAPELPKVKCPCCKSPMKMVVAKTDLQTARQSYRSMLKNRSPPAFWIDSHKIS